MPHSQNFTHQLYITYYTDVMVMFQSQVNAVTEGNSYVAHISVEPTSLMASFDVIVQTYSCGGYSTATRKRYLLVQ